MDESEAWIAQANADYAAAEREREFADSLKEPIWCHAVAKYQQAVEKSIKGVVAAFHECGLRGMHPIGHDHRVQNHLRLLRKLPGGWAGATIQRKLRDFLNAAVKNSIQKLESLIPKWPAPGAPYLRNTEYPFNTPRGRWTYPAAQRTFSAAEVKEFQTLTRRVAYTATNIVAALRRSPA
jgi:hypothetical protein